MLPHFLLSKSSLARNQIVCTKTHYNYVDLGLLSIKNIDLSQKLKRHTKSSRIRQNKRILGRSIEDRPKEIETRGEFGHWEADVVIGSKKSLRKEYAEHFDGIFKTITTDNGTEFSSLASFEQISQIELWCNSLPRKILQYRTPDEVFEGEIDRIYGMSAV